MMAVPLLRTLHVAGWRVDTVVDEGFAGLESTYAHHVRHQHLVPVKTWRKRSLLYDVPGRLGLVARIRRERYDALIQVGTGSLGIWLTWAARVPVSIAQDVHHKVAVNRWAYRAVITHRIPVDDHAAAENMAFASALGIAPVTNYPEARGSASSGLRQPPGSLIRVSPLTAITATRPCRCSRDIPTCEPRSSREVGVRGVSPASTPPPPIDQ